MHKSTSSATTTKPPPSKPATTTKPPPSKPATTTKPPPSKPATTTKPPPSKPATTTKPPPSKPANNQFRNVQQGDTFREQNTSSATVSTTQNDSRRISTGPPRRTGETCFACGKMATGDNLLHSQEIIPDNEAETYEDKYFHSSHISSLNEPPGNCIKDSGFKSGEKGCIVKGSLKNHLQFWHKIGANVSVIDVLENGYKIPLITLPKAAKFPNNHSALNNANFVTQTVEELLNTGRIKEVKNPPYAVNPLSLSENGSHKLRLILDLRYVNKHVFKDKIKFDDWKIMQDFLEPTDLLFKFDISQGHHHIDIDEQHQKYLGFSWKIKGQTRYFVFTVLPFGFTSAPFLLTKVMRCLVTFWRAQGIKISVFIDDGLGSADKVQSNIHSLVVKKSLTEAGFVINTQKSIWQPQRELTWLGVNINLGKLCFSIPLTRMVSFSFSLEKIINILSYTTARKLAKFCG